MCTVVCYLALLVLPVYRKAKKDVFGGGAGLGGGTQVNSSYRQFCQSIIRRRKFSCCCFYIILYRLVNADVSVDAAVQTRPPPPPLSHFVLSMLSSLDFLVLSVCRQTWKDCLSLLVSQCLLSRLVSVGLLSDQERSVCCFTLSLNELQVRQLTELKQSNL